MFVYFVLIVMHHTCNHIKCSQITSFCSLDKHWSMATVKSISVNCGVFAREGEGGCTGVMYPLLPLGQSSVAPVPTSPIRIAIQEGLCGPSYCHLLSCPVCGNTG